MVENCFSHQTNEGRHRRRRWLPARQRGIYRTYTSTFSKLALDPAVEGKSYNCAQSRYLTYAGATNSSVDAVTLFDVAADRARALGCHRVVKAIQEGGNLSYEQAWEIAKAQNMKLFASSIEAILCACAVKASSTQRRPRNRLNFRTERQSLLSCNKQYFLHAF